MVAAACGFYGKHPETNQRIWPAVWHAWQLPASISPSVFWDIGYRNKAAHCGKQFDLQRLIGVKVRNRHCVTGSTTPKPHVGLLPNLAETVQLSEWTASSAEDCSDSCVPTRPLLMSALFETFRFTAAERKSRLIRTRCWVSRRESIQHHPKPTKMNHKDKQDFSSPQNGD